MAVGRDCLQVTKSQSHYTNLDPNPDEVDKKKLQYIDF